MSVDMNKPVLEDPQVSTFDKDELDEQACFTATAS